MSGQRLSRWIKRASPTDRALVANDLAHGAMQLTRLTRAQAAALTGASLGYINTIAHLSEDARLRVAKGELSLSHLHHRQNPTDAELDRVVRHYGAAALWRAFDRATTPRGDNGAINGMTAK